jgi:type IV pilus assembly protein PilW
VANGYYVSQRSDQNIGTPSLRRKQLAFVDGAPAIRDQEIVPGVEDLQVEFGVDLDVDQNADYFVPPGTAIAPGQDIVAVRIWLLVRAEQPEFSFTDDRTYAYADRVGGAAYAPGDHFRRVLVSKTVALRNTRR